MKPHAFDILTPQEEVIYCMRTGNPYRPHDLRFIGAVFNLSHQRIAELERIILEKIRKKLKASKTYFVIEASFDVYGRV